MTSSTLRPTERAAVAPSAGRLTLLHLRYQFLETVRIPIAVIGNALFPALALFFFVVPQDEVAADPLQSTIAVASLALFAIASANIFTHGIGVAEDRALPFDSLMRCLPAGPGPRMAGRILNGGAFSLLALVPLVFISWIFTEAGAPPARLAAGIGVLLLASVPFTFLGLAIGYATSAKAAIAVVQVTLFPLAFLGGLFLPPFLFPDWLNTLSLATPTRAGRDALIQALTGEGLHASTIPVLVAWALVLAALAVVAYRRDEGRRYR